MQKCSDVHPRTFSVHIFQLQKLLEPGDYCNAVNASHTEFRLSDLQEVFSPLETFLEFKNLMVTESCIF
jgi:hypothetical protein